MFVSKFVCALVFGPRDQTSGRHCAPRPLIANEWRTEYSQVLNIHKTKGRNTKEKSILYVHCAKNMSHKLKEEVEESTV